MGWLIVLAIVGVMGYGTGYWIGWWKRHKLGLVVENDLSHRLANAKAENERLRRELEEHIAGEEENARILRELFGPRSTMSEQELFDGIEEATDETPTA